MHFEIFSDQGCNFEYKLFCELHKVLEIHKVRTTPYGPSGNEQVEMYNRTLMDAVRCLIGKSQKQCGIQIVGALRSSVNWMICFTAIMMGKKVNTPAAAWCSHQNIMLSSRHWLCLFVSLSLPWRRPAKQLASPWKLFQIEWNVIIICAFLRESTLGCICWTLSGWKANVNNKLPPWKGPDVIVCKLSSYTLF
jgi:hypothetical protein